MPDFQVDVVNSGEPVLRDGAFEARLVFAPRRSRFVGVKVGKSRHDEERKDWGQLGSFSSPVLLWVTWEKPLLRGERLPLVVSYEGEPPMSLRIEFSDKIDKEVKARLRQNDLPPGDAPRIRREIIEEQEGVVLRDTPMLIRQFITQRSDCIEMVANQKRRAQMKFFLEYDTETHPGFLNYNGQQERETLITEATKKLRARAIKRLSSGTRKVPSLAKDVAQQLSDLQLAIFNKHFGDITQEARRAEFREAFIAFASRKLEPDPNSPCENHYWNGRPNSAYFFLFAEFAIQAVALNVNRDVWRKLLPIFVQCQDLYANVFPPFCDEPPPAVVVEEEKRTFDMYGDAGSRQPEVDPVPLTAQMKNRYADIDTATITKLKNFHSANVKRFFPRGDSGSIDPCNPDP